MKKIKSFQISMIFATLLLVGCSNKTQKIITMIEGKETKELYSVGLEGFKNGSVYSLRDDKLIFLGDRFITMTDTVLVLSEERQAGTVDETFRSVWDKQSARLEAVQYIYTQPLDSLVFLELMNSGKMQPPLVVGNKVIKGNFPKNVLKKVRKLRKRVYKELKTSEE